jgi:cobalt transporter subunit CbtB
MYSPETLPRSRRFATLSERTRTALAAAALGVMILWAVGFSPAGIVHNAAHDTRHTMAFPCH